MNHPPHLGAKTACAAGLLCLMAACVGTPGARYYTLAVLAPPPAGARTDLTLGVGAVRVARHLRQPAMIRRTSAYELRHCEFDLWAEPLEDSIASVTAENLARLTAARRVLLSPWSAADAPERQLTLTVEACELNPKGQAELRLRWELRDAAGTLIEAASTNLCEPAGDDIANLAPALSRALLTFARNLTPALEH